MYKSDSSTTAFIMKEREDYVPTNLEERENVLYELNKKDQVNILMELGASKKQINRMKTEKQRVYYIIGMRNKRANDKQQATTK